MTNTTAQFGSETVTPLRIVSNKTLVRYVDDSTVWVRTERLVMSEILRDTVMMRTAMAAGRKQLGAWGRNDYPGTD